MHFVRVVSIAGVCIYSYLLASNLWFAVSQPVVSEITLVTDVSWYAQLLGIIPAVLTPINLFLVWCLICSIIVMLNCKAKNGGLENRLAK